MVIACVESSPQVIPYDPAWASLYEEERSRIERAIDGAALDIQHVGSTAVPGLTAVPIINLLVGVRRLPLRGTDLIAMRSLGYESGAEDEGLLFVRRAPFTVHADVVLHGGAAWTQRLRFRDALRNDPSLVRDYVAQARARRG